MMGGTVGAMRLILAGGGEAADSVPLDRLFARWTSHGTVLYWPFASDSPPDACLEWFESTYGPLGVRDVVMWRSLDEIGDADLSEFTGIYIGGGNTYSLLDALRRSGAANSLAAYAHAGNAIYGGSAGAIVLGCDIDTARHSDTNQVALQDTTGLDLASGYAVWCHYRTDQAPLVRAWFRETDRRVLCLSERTGIVREGDDLHVAGFDPVFRVDQDGVTEFRSGERIGT